MAITMIIVSPRRARFVNRFGAQNVVTVGLVTLAAGMGLSMPPATTAILGAPPAKAGVASAVNDTTREVGGALGIAVLGNLMSSAYRSNIEGDLEGLPPEVFEAAGESISATLRVAGTIEGPEGAALATAAGESFADAMGAEMLAGAILVAINAVATFRFMPNSVQPAYGEPEVETAEVRD